MKSLLAQIENLIEKKVRDHIDYTHRYSSANKAKEIAVRDLIESVTEDMAEKLVEQFVEPIIEAHI